MGKAEVLLSLHDSAAHNGQVEAWDADLKAFEALKTDHEDELRRVRGEAYQAASMYVMFQGVIFTAVSQSNLLTCSLSWSPAFISLAASVATFLAIVDKLKSIGEVKEDIKEAGLSISALFECLEKVDQQGSALDLETEYARIDYQRYERAGYRFIFSRDGLCVLLFLILFSILISAFCIVTLCKNCTYCDPT